MDHFIRHCPTMHRMWVTTNRYSITLIAFRGIQSGFDSTNGSVNNKLVFAQNDVRDKGLCGYFRMFCTVMEPSNFGLLVLGKAFIRHKKGAPKDSLYS